MFIMQIYFTSQLPFLTKRNAELAWGVVLLSGPTIYSPYCDPRVAPVLSLDLDTFKVHVKEFLLVQ